MIDQLKPDYWHSKAEEARTRGEEMHDPDARRTMLQIAMMYSGMALRLEVRIACRKAARLAGCCPDAARL
jgi:hypothetical protein